MPTNQHSNYNNLTYCNYVILLSVDTLHNHKKGNKSPNNLEIPPYIGSAETSLNPRRKTP
jgi:hypothetical protein